MGIKVSDIFESTTFDKFIVEAINVKYGTKSQHYVNDDLYSKLLVLSNLIEDTYNKSEIDNIVSHLISFDVQIVESLPTENISLTTFYLTLDTTASVETYIEWLYINGSWRSIGRTALDLSSYVTTAALTTALAPINTRISELTQAINNLSTQIDSLSNNYNNLNTRTNNLDDDVSQLGREINILSQRIDNISGSPSQLDEIDSSNVIYNDTNVKEVLDRLLYTPPTASLTITVPSVKNYEYGNSLSSLEGTITFSTYNNVVTRLVLIYKVNNTTYTNQITVPENALSVNFRISASLSDTTEIYAEITDDKNVTKSSIKQYINFMYKSFCFVSGKSTISTSDIPTTGGYLKPTKALGRVNFQCTAQTPYAYIVIPTAYCNSEPIITDTNGFTITLPDSCKYTLSDYVNHEGITVPMNVYRLKNPEQVPITVNIN